MSKKIVNAIAIAAVLAFSALPPLLAQLPALHEMGKDLYVQARFSANGEATLGVWNRDGGLKMTQVLPQVLHCASGLKADENGGNSIRCSQALVRNGLSLNAQLDLAPIARALNTPEPIELWVNYPRLGFESLSIDMNDEDSEGPRISRTALFEPGAVPSPITISFGFRPAQLTAIYLPLLLLALALTAIAFLISRAGFAALGLAEIMLGTMVWMCACAQLQADGPLQILLLGNPLAQIAVVFIDLWPPLFCVAIGVAIGSRMRNRAPLRGKFAEVAGAYAVVPLILTGVAGALPAINSANWPAVVAWVATAPVALLMRRAWNRSRSRATVKQLTSGELHERVAALGVKAGWRQLKLYISYSARSQTANAFALPGRSIFLTAPLVRTLNKREVDAVAAHELAHIQKASRGMWMALLLSLLFCNPPIGDFVYMLPGGLATAILIPMAVYIASLSGSRKREFAADAHSAALTGDPRSMISSLARVARSNSQPLEMPGMIEWFSSHPSTRKRVQRLAASARIERKELDELCNNDQPGEHYDLASEQTGLPLFTLAWQQHNSNSYSWAVLLGSCAAGLLAAWCIGSFARWGAFGIMISIVVGCGLVRSAAAYIMSSNYARLRVKLEAKLGISGEIVGLAPERIARVYNSFRFSDAGLLQFENGMLCYRSEQTTIRLNAADVIQVGVVAAAPSNWIRRQPMIEFRDPQSEQTRAVILHTLGWLPTQQKLLRSIERWRQTERSDEPTSVEGFKPATGEPFINPTIAVVVRGFIVPAVATPLLATVICIAARANWSYIAWALASAACAYFSMLLPSMLYRPVAPSIEPAPAATSE